MKEKTIQRLITILSFVVMIVTGALAAIPSAQAALSTADLNSGLTPTDLANLLVGGGGGGVTISNVHYTGANVAAGKFSGGGAGPTGIIGFEDGIILSSGDIANVVGPNNDPRKTTNNGQPGDADLNTLIPGYTTFDAAVLEFDFVPQGNVVTFNYVFGSEEYNEYVNSIFNNVFGFFLNGQNIALIPGTTTPVAINNVNNGNLCPAGPYPPTASNPSYFRINDLTAPPDCTFNPGSIDTQLDGLTVVLPATANVKRGQTNHIRLAIGDAGDSILDSDVFIQAGSFVSYNLNLEPLTATNPIGSTHTLTAKLTKPDGSGIPGQTITFTVTAGPNAGLTGTAVTDVNGEATFSYTGTTIGTDTIIAEAKDLGITTDPVEKIWIGGSISGVKFDDTNGNKAKDTGEPGIGGWTITLTKPDGSTVPTTTASDGSYSFTNLPDGTYTVAETLKSGYIQTVPGVSETGSATYTIEIKGGNKVVDKDFGNYKLGEVHGMKFNDVNGNGKKDTGDTGLEGWQISLTGTDTITNTPVSMTTTTDASGNYNFSGLTAGTYTISETLKNGWIQTAPGVSTTGSATYTVTIGDSGTVITAKDFGNFKLGEVDGQKFEDLNANGVKDNSEVGLAGWQINLTGTDTITNTPIGMTTTTDSNGNYNFIGLTAGTYTVSETLQNGWVQTTPSTVTYTVTILSGSVVTGQDFGNFHKGKITGGGWINITGDPKATFGIVGQYPDSSNTAQGNVEYQDHIANLNIKSIQINTVATTLDKKKGAITGLAQVNGAGSYPFVVYVEDNAEPGVDADVFKISLPTYPYSNGAILSGGNIQIHK